MASSLVARGCTGRQTSDGDCDWAHPLLIGSGGWTGGVAGRVAATGRWWRGRGNSNCGEDRGGAGQRMARAASLGPSGGPEGVGWLGDRAEGGARRRQQWGGHREL
jgi:hypothetical protein